MGAAASGKGSGEEILNSPEDDDGSEVESKDDDLVCWFLGVLQHHFFLLGGWGRILWPSLCFVWAVSVVSWPFATKLVDFASGWFCLLGDVVLPLDDALAKWSSSFAFSSCEGHWLGFFGGVAEAGHSFLAFSHPWLCSVCAFGGWLGCGVGCCSCGEDPSGCVFSIPLGDDGGCCVLLCCL